MTEVYTWDDVARGDYFIDYQNLYTHLGVLSIRELFVSCSDIFLAAGERERALEMIDKCVDVMQHYPLETVPLGFSNNDYMVVLMIDRYYELGQADKARALAVQMGSELLKSAQFYLEFFEFGKDEFDLIRQFIYALADVMKAGGDADLSTQLTDNLVTLVDKALEVLNAS